MVAGAIVSWPQFVFLNRRAADFFDDWASIARDAVTVLRATASRDPHDRRLSDLIGELTPRMTFSTHSLEVAP